MDNKTLDKLIATADRFRPAGSIIDIREFGGGNINKTFLVTLDSKEEKRFILQRINTKVFHQPELVMRNMRICTEHMLRRLHGSSSIAGRRWEVPRVLLTTDGMDYRLDPDGSFWRAISFIDDSRSFDTVRNIEHAREAGCALGIFHSLLSDLPADVLADTLEGFHITPLYLRHFNEVLEKYSVAGTPEVDYCLQFISERSAWAHVLEKAKAEGKLRLRVIHGDPKINNVLIDAETGKAVGIIDLDTVKPGLVHYDIGDCLRSVCNPLGEETDRPEDVHFDLALCRAVLQGYQSTAGGLLSENDFDYLFDSIRLIAFELGLRFFTDYLEGNVYFRVNRPSHNLQRALVQFKLTESIESRETEIRGIIRDMK